MKRKITVAVVIVLFLAVPAAADIRYSIITNVFPDTGTTLDQGHDINVITNTQTDAAASDFTLTLFILHPNGTRMNNSFESESADNADELWKHGFHVPNNIIQAPGEYRFNLTTKDTTTGDTMTSTANYTVTEPGELSGINDMAVQLAAILALILVAGLFAYTGVNMNPRDKKIAVLRTVLITAAPAFAFTAVGLAAVFAGGAGFGAANSILWTTFLAAFGLWFFMLLVIGIVVYFTDAMETAASMGRDEFDHEV